MSLEIKAKIDVTKILKDHLYQGSKGKYLDVAFFKNDSGPDKYDQDGFIVQEISKEARQNGEKGPIIGNWKYHQPSQPKPVATAKAAGFKPNDDDDVPF